MSDQLPEIVTLCGSTRFKAAYERETARLTLEGIIVISVGMFGHSVGLDPDGDVKKRLDELHLRKIDLCDRVHVINDRAVVCTQCGKPCHFQTPDPWGVPFTSVCCKAAVENKCYVGESTKREIEYAKIKGKPITYLNAATNT